VFAQVTIQIGERFIHQQQVRTWRQRTRHGDTLLLPAGEFMRILVRSCSQTYHLQQLHHTRTAQRFFHLMQAEGHILEHRQMRKQGVILKHHADTALLSRQTEIRRGHRRSVEPDLPCAQALETGNQPQYRSLAATGWPQQTADLPFCQLQ
jgi:hypothetical protein